jgi:hypothetical protein
MKRCLDVTDLGVEGFADGSMKVTVWCKCFTPDDIDDVISWLQLAKTMMESWETIRENVGVKP